MSIGTVAEKPAVPVDVLADHVARLRMVQLHIKTLTETAEQIKAAIQDALGEAEVGTVHGRPVVTWTRHVRHALDQKAFKDNEPELYAAYLKASSYRRFTVIEEEPDADE